MGNKIKTLLIAAFLLTGQLAKANPLLGGYLQTGEALAEFVKNGTQANALHNLGGAPLASPVFTGTVSTPALTVSGAASVGSLNDSGAASANTLSVTNTASAGSLSTTGSTTTGSFTDNGAASVGSLSVVGAAVVNSLTSTNAVSAASLGVSGLGSFGSLTDSGAATVGSLSTAGSIAASYLSVSGTNSFGNIGGMTVIPSDTTTGTNLSTLFGRWYSLDDFNCTGDGVTDDSACWNRAQAALTHGGVLRLPRIYHLVNPNPIAPGVYVDGGNPVPGTQSADFALIPNSQAGDALFFTANPSSGDTITINTQVITFETTVTNALTQIQIGSSIAATMTNAANMLNGSTNSLLTPMTYTAGDFKPPYISSEMGTLEILDKTGGTAGNSIQIEASVAHKTSSHLTGGGLPYHNGTLIIDNPLVLSSDSGIGGTFIVATGLISPPPGPATMYNQVKNFINNGNAIQNSANASDWVVENNTIIGFDNGVISNSSSNTGRYHIVHNNFDDTNDVNLSNVADVSEIRDNRSNAFYSTFGYGINLNVRIGIAYQIYNGDSSSSLENNFDDGHVIGYSVGPEFGITCERCSFGGANIGANSAGLTVPGPLAYVPKMTTVGTNYSANPTITASCGGTFVPTLVPISPGSSYNFIAALTNTAPVDNCNGTAPTITISDTTGTGATATAALTWSIGLQSYGQVNRLTVVNPVDDEASIAYLFNGWQDQTLENAQVGSTGLNDVIVNVGPLSIQGGYFTSAPQSNHIVFNSTSYGGSVVAAHLLDQNTIPGISDLTQYPEPPVVCVANTYGNGLTWSQYNMYGDNCSNTVAYSGSAAGSSVRFTDINGNHPYLEVQPNNTVAFYGVDNNGNSSASTEVWSFANGTGNVPTFIANHNFALYGHMASLGTAPTITNGVPSSTASDLMGSVTENASVSSTVITWATPYTSAPDCIVSSPSGVAFTYTPTATNLTINNATASGDKFTWHCEQ